jgi:predicted dehydrogenase
MSDDNGRPDMTRRQFLESTGTAALTAAAGSLLTARTVAAAPGRVAAAGARVIGANDRIQVGIVGVKGMGGGHIKHILEGMPGENVAITAVCDVWEKARRTAQASTHLGDDRVYSDYRRMLDAKDIDAVIVATPDHTHARIAIDVMESGRNLYVQKPMVRKLDDGFRMLDVARRTGRVVQVGTQGCTDPKFHRAREIVKSGALGRLLWAQASYCRQNPTGEWNYTIDPEATAGSVDWNAWLGSAPKRSFSAERYFRWRKYWDYGTGVIGDLLPHRLSPTLMAMGVDEYPQTVTCLGGNLADTDRGPGPDGKPYG